MRYIIIMLLLLTACSKTEQPTPNTPQHPTQSQQPSKQKYLLVFYVGAEHPSKITYASVNGIRFNQTHIDSFEVGQNISGQVAAQKLFDATTGKYYSPKTTLIVKIRTGKHDFGIWLDSTIYRVDEYNDIMYSFQLK
jgi:hypothetical protein